VAIEIISFYENDSGTWTYLLSDTTTQSAVIIDPVWVFNPVSGMVDSEFINQVLAIAKQKNLHIDWVLETHAHADHLTAAGEIRRRTGARIACGKGICSVQETFARVFNMAGLATDGRQFDRLLEEGDRIDLGALEIQVIETPGHTNDSVTYLVEDAAFIGDTLFAPSFGTARCDFPGGDAGQLYDSISKIYQLPGATRVFLCHDYPKAGNQPVCQITVDESRGGNIHFSAETTRDEFVAMRTARDAQLGLPRLIMPSLQVNIQAGEAPAAENNGVVYLKTPFNCKIADLIQLQERA
jgi:glyoxylase-like metal-dependent hydrolase (beta-lactamase superfamily II)